MSNRWRALLVAGALTAASVAANAPLGAQQDAPPAPDAGRDIVLTACTQCHAVSVITHVRWGREAWRHEVYDMVERGAQISPNELDAVVNYLTANFGPGVPFPGETPSHVNVPSGAGADIVGTRCVMCHSVDRVTSASRSRAQWNAVVARMVFFGAPLSGAQSETVVDYLTAHYGNGR